MVLRVIGISEEKKGPRNYKLIDNWVRQINVQLLEDDVGRGEVEVWIGVECWQVYEFKTWYGVTKKGYGKLKNGEVEIQVGIMGLRSKRSYVAEIKDGYAIFEVKIPRHPKKSTYVSAKIVKPKKTREIWRTV